jgi:ATP-dependent RNA helicase DHX57
MDFSKNKKVVDDDAAQMDKYAIKKLESYGFHPSRCVEALSKANQDVGLAFELLMAECFGLFDLQPQVAASCSNPETDEKEDEKMALESIYGEQAFAVKIPGKLWELTLNLPALLRLLTSDVGQKAKKSVQLSRAQLEKEKDVCQFFLRGHCKYGKKCYKKHVTPEKESYVDDKHLQAFAEEKVFLLEIRFPDKCTYPMSAPLASFNTPMSNISRQVCLKITARLMQEAKNHALDHLPSVFALVSLLDNIDEIKAVVKGQDVAFSFASGLEPPGSLNTSGVNATEKLMSSLGVASTNNSSSRSNGEPFKRNFRNIRLDNTKILDRYQKNKASTPKLLGQRKSLPAWSEQGKILQKLERNQVLVISGMTGCGKSTQVPQYILDGGLKDGKVHNIICTQPRRISAIGVAERVAQERDEKVGNMVGYQIRLESKTSAMTRLLFCTTGILLRRLESDPELNEVSHVIIDEVHERSEESDFLLMIIRDLLPRRPELRILLMSATLNATLFASYFGSGIPVIDIPGRTFPVHQFYLEKIIDRVGYCLEERSQFAKRRPKNVENKANVDAAKKRINKMGKDIFLDDYDAEMLFGQSNEGFKPAKDNLEDEQLSVKQIHHRYNNCDEHTQRTLSLMDFDKINYDLVEQVLVHILDCSDYPAQGSILVFLPGMQEIMTLYDQINRHPVLGRCKILPLHSSLSSEEQSMIFVKTKQRKIVISTNLAETSITIDDCVFVVEVGRMKEKRFDPAKNMESLDTIWVSKANALQRKGRAGRVMAGLCFHLYTQFRYDNHFRKDPVPEIHRVPLEQMLLRIKIMPLFHNKLNVKDVLANLIEPPNYENVNSALERLRGVGALDQQEALTPLGYHLASLPVDVRIGKLMILGAMFKCLDSTLTMAACLSYKSPFVAPFSKREEARKRRMTFALWNSDQITDLQAYNAWRTAQKVSYNAGYAFCQV